MLPLLLPLLKRRRQLLLLLVCFIFIVICRIFNNNSLIFIRNETKWLKIYRLQWNEYYLKPSPPPSTKIIIVIIIALLEWMNMSVSRRHNLCAHNRLEHACTVCENLSIFFIVFNVFDRETETEGETWKTESNRASGTRKKQYGSIKTGEIVMRRMKIWNIHTFFTYSTRILKANHLIDWQMISMFAFCLFFSPPLFSSLHFVEHR